TTLSQRDVADILLVPIIVLAAWIVLLIVLQFVLKEKPVEGAEAETIPIEEQSGEGTEAETASTEEQLGEDVEAETAPAEEQSGEESQEIAGTFENEEEKLEETVPEEEAEATELDEEIEELFQDQEPFSEEKIPGAKSAAEIPPQPEAVSDVEMPAPKEKTVPEEAGADMTPFPVSEENFEAAEFVAPPQKAEEPAVSETFPATLSMNTLRRTLETELQRNRETSLLLIQCMFTGASDPSALALGVTIRDYFASASLVFELAKGCYAAVLPGTDAGSSLKLAVDLDDVLTTTASLYKDLTEEPPFYFGISALYDRTISPERLYKEALAALNKAHESGSRILAFKPAIAAT
ncbi:MAG: hypothetical protein ABFC65_02380, partial [Rectinema sp.]